MNASIPDTQHATKKDLVKSLQTRIDASNKVAGDIVDAVLESIADLTHTRGKLLLRGFGKFETRVRAPRRVSTGVTHGAQPFEVPAKVAMCFTASPDQVHVVG